MPLTPAIRPLTAISITADRPISAPPIVDATGVKEVTVIRLIFLSMHRLRKYAKGSLAALEAKVQEASEEASHLLNAKGNVRRQIVLCILPRRREIGERFRSFNTVQPCGDFLRANEAEPIRRLLMSDGTNICFRMINSRLLFVSREPLAMGLTEPPAEPHN